MGTLRAGSVEAFVAVAHGEKVGDRASDEAQPRAAAADRFAAVASLHGVEVEVWKDENVRDARMRRGESPG